MRSLRRGLAADEGRLVGVLADLGPDGEAVDREERDQRDQGYRQRPCRCHSGGDRLAAALRSAAAGARFRGRDQVLEEAAGV